MENSNTYLMENYFKTDGIAFWEPSIKNDLAYYLAQHPDHFKKILDCIDYGEIVSIYGEVGTIDKIFEYYSYRDALSKYFTWIDKMESECKSVYCKISKNEANKYCGACNNTIEFNFADFDSDRKCPYCGAPLYSKNQYRRQYGYDVSHMRNYNELILIDNNDLL